MFTDSTATPMRVEVLLELVWEMRERKLDRNAIRKFLQPTGLPGLSPSSKQSLETLNAARQLGLLKEDGDSSFRPSWNVRKPFVANDILLSAIDEKVLSSTEVETWFARFFSYIITKEDDVLSPGNASGEKWANDFNRDLFGGSLPGNPFNSTKYTGLRRWFRYAGLGWHDAEDNFIPCPYNRVRRKLQDIFGKKHKLSSNEFMTNLASNCPELDNGAIFREANKGVDLVRTCTRALAIVLRDLHDDKVIRLNCPSDSRGWNLIRAGSIRNPQEGLQSDNFDYVELVRNQKP